MKRSQKQLSSNENFSTFLQLSCFKFKLKLCEALELQKLCSVGCVISKKLFPETIIYKIFEINSSFHVNLRNTGKF